MKKNREPESALDAAARKLSYGSCSAEDLKSALRRKDYPDEEIDEAVRQLKAYGYLDDARFAADYFHFAFERGRSRKRAEAELLEKHVSRGDIDKGYEQYVERAGEPDETARARREAGKVLREAGVTKSAVPEKIRGRVARRLAAKGYAAAVIYDILEELEGPDDPEGGPAG